MCVLIVELYGCASGSKLQTTLDSSRPVLSTRLADSSRLALNLAAVSVIRCP